MRRSAGHRLRALSQFGFAPLLERVLASKWPARVQRLGSQALQRVSRRFPALADLIEEGTRRVDGWLAERGLGGQSAPSYAPAPVTQQAKQKIDRDEAAVVRALSEGLGESTWQARGAAIAEWGGVPCRASVPLLVEALRDPSAEVASAAAVALGNQGTASARAALRGVLANADGYFNPVTRAAAVQGLARCAGEAELEALYAAMTDVDAEVSLAAIAALAEGAPQKAAPRLFEILEDGTGYFLSPVRVAAARALVRTSLWSEREVARLLSMEADPTVQSILSDATAAN